jgi:NDP-mannose synthase
LRQAIILAGGKGTRLRPFTATLPKPLVPVGDMPIIDVVIRQLKKAGFEEAVLSVGHMAELIEAYCGNGARWGLSIRYVREEKPLSTAGSLKLVEGLQPEFLTINGDILTTIDFKKLLAFHDKTQSLATVAVCERKIVVDFGVIDLAEDGVVTDYTERPENRHVVSMGINVFSRRVVDYIQEGEVLGVPDLIRRLLAAGEKVSGFLSSCDWLDIGHTQDYETAQSIFQSPKRRHYLK